MEVTDPSCMLICTCIVEGVGIHSLVAMRSELEELVVSFNTAALWQFDSDIVQKKGSDSAPKVWEGQAFLSPIPIRSSLT